MKVTIKGKTVDLGDRNFLAQGGEGSIYIKGKTAFKIYTDSSKMIPTGKIDELAILTNQKIIKPEDIIFKKSKAAGYTMRYVKDTYALCQLFTKAFRNRNSLSNDISLMLARDMQATVQHIHANKILVVDLNEMNFLVDQKFKEVYFIDVDSYQTPNYPATALMESIRDRHSKGFSKETDWFAWAIVSFQLLIGIHPYKGKHPKIKGLDDRMKKNISVFNSDVNIPKSCLPIDIIPKALKKWYLKVFEDGERSEPPTDFSTVSIPVVTSTYSYIDWQSCKVEELCELAWDIVGYAKQNQKECILGTSHIYVDRRHDIQVKETPIVGFYNSNAIAAKIDQGKLRLFHTTFQKLLDHNEISAEAIMSYNGRIYVKFGRSVLEVQFHGPENQPIISTLKVGNVMEQATKTFPGVIIQNMLGACYASIFETSGSCVQIRIPELDAYQILDAKFSQGILMVVGTQKGQYDRFIFRLKDGKVVEKRCISNITYSGLNFIVLDKGVCVSLTEQEEIEIFHRNALSKIKLLSDKQIHGDMRLFTDGARVLFADGKKLHSITMK